MRLYKNVKVETTADVTVIIYCKDSHVTSSDDYKKILDIKDSFSNELKPIVEWSIITNFGGGDTMILKSISIPRPKVQATAQTDKYTKLNAVVEASFNIAIYGKLYLGEGSNFEDSFETQSGLKIQEVVTTDNMKNYIIKQLVKKYDENDIDIEISYTLGDEFKLLLDDDEVRDYIIEHQDHIMEAVDERIRDYMNPDYD